jgi:hypothetical protein
MGRRGARRGRLLVAVEAMSGRRYPAGTELRLVGTGAAVDGWVGCEWVPLRWWEFTELDEAESAGRDGGAAAR